AYSYNGLIGNVIAVASPGAGYYSSQRTSSTSHKLYFANSGNAHAQIGSTDSTSFAGSYPNSTIYSHAEHLTTLGVQFYTTDRISFWAAIVPGFSSTESATFFSMVQTLRTNLGGGYV